MKTRWSVSFMLVLLFALVNTGLAQQHDTSGGKTEIVQDDRVELLIEKHIQINQVQNTMNGFRIQVFSDSGINSKAKAQAVLDELQTRYPDNRVYLSFKSPNYRVRVGDFRTKLDAQRFLIELTADYPNAFIIDDQINLPKAD